MTFAVVIVTKRTTAVHRTLFALFSADWLIMAWNPFLEL
jgi:hypothetical protein